MPDEPLLNVSVGGFLIYLFLKLMFDFLKFKAEVDEKKDEREAAERGKPVNGSSGAQPPSYWILEFRNAIDQSNAEQDKRIAGMIDRAVSDLERRMLREQRERDARDGS